ncbi:hypothetical protein EDD18DRAFT_1108530 [Armillaria luteobubalina]|uniref:Uncharacterized protein n=1 Tax=Armillaria luteobubalina TaxID=153913 RepID=A0AA39PYK6_9AGAR|nr:hypothetical protein EDD18DRAFT_1108530 [Armillaria luteobubalina]
MTTVSLPLSASTSDLKSAIQNSGGTPIPVSAHLLTHPGQRLQAVRTSLWWGRQMRKPCFYLHREDAFNAVYPSVPIKDTELGQSIVWDVYTHEDHSLTTTTGTRVFYLFWEADTPLPPASFVLTRPMPDIVTRVCTDELEEWEGGCGGWGWDGDEAEAEELFRVVEWGGVGWRLGSEWTREVPLMYEWWLSLLISTFTCGMRMAQKSLRDEGGIPAFSFQNHTQRGCNLNKVEPMDAVFVYKNGSRMMVDVSLREDRIKGQRWASAYIAIGYHRMPIYVAIKDDVECATSREGVQELRETTRSFEGFGEITPGAYPREW